MANQKIIYTQFNGGIIPNTKSGVPNGGRIMENLDIFSDADAVTLNPKTAKISSTTAVDLGKWMVEATPYSTDKYAYGDAGKIYKIDSSDVVTVDRTVSGGAGQGLAVVAGYLYYPTSTTIGRLGIAPSVAYNDDFLTNGIDDLDLVGSDSATVTGQTYTPPTSITESAANQQDFVPNFDPLRKVQVWVTAKGTGNWTVTVHDDLNDASLGAATVANASLSNGAYNDFTFSTPLRVEIGKTYHFHVTSTVADGTLRSGTSSSMATADYKTFMGILIADTEYHPMIQHTNGVGATLLTGNEHYISEYTQAGAYNPNKITLEPGFKVRFFTIENEYVVAWCWKGSTIDGSEQGKMYYWDGIQNYYNFAKPITGGLPNAAINYKGQTFSILGSTGDMHIGMDPFYKIQSMPKLARGKKIEVMPGAIDVWQGKVVIGVGTGTDDSTGLRQGVYQFGSNSDRSLGTDTPEVLNFGFKISTGTTQSTSMKIGCVKAFGNALYIWWKDGSTYGCDKVSKTGNAATSGLWESPITDRGSSDGKSLQSMPDKFKQAVKVVTTFEALPAGCTVKSKYKLDRASTGGTDNDGWFDSSAASEGATRAELFVGGLGNERYKEAEHGFEITSSSGNYPVITSHYFEYDALVKEGEDVDI